MNTFFVVVFIFVAVAVAFAVAIVVGVWWASNFAHSKGQTVESFLIYVPGASGVDFINF